MNRPLRFLPVCILFLLFFALTQNAYSQTATVVVNSTDPRHETIEQDAVLVTFSQPLTGTTSNGQWTVRINGTIVPVLNAAYTGNEVLVTFDPSAVNGDLDPGTFGVQTSLLPGQSLTVAFNNTGNTLTTSGSGNPATGFAPVASKNNYPIDCNELGFSSQGNYSTVQICAPVAITFYQWTYFMSMRLRNSTAFRGGVNVPGSLKIIVNYNDPANYGEAYWPYQSDLSGNANSSFYTFGSVLGGNGPVVAYTIRPTNFVYPVNSGLCSFTAVTTPEYHNLQNCGVGTLPVQTLFNSYDNDDKNTGVLSIRESVIDTDKVCLGTNADVTFSDMTFLNCEGPPVPASAASSPNTLVRWMRIIYGYQNAPAPGNIPNIVVGGVPVTDASGALIAPFNANPVLKGVPGYAPTGAGGFGTPDAQGVIRLATPVTAATATAFAKQIITSSFAGQVVNQRFYVRLQYWNTCNPYNSFAADPSINAVSTDDFVQIIISPNPPTVNNPVLCEIAANASFEITATASGTGTLTYTWYKDAALTTVLRGPNTDNTFNPVTEGPTGDLINKTVTGSQTFHRYVTVTQGSNGCTSPPADITIRIDDTNTAGTIAHPLAATPITICSGTDPVAFTSTTDGTGGGPGGTFTYQWQSATNAAFTAGLTNIVGATSNVFDPPVINSGIFYRRRVSSGSCGDVFSNAIEFRVNTPAVGGTIANGQILCSGVTNPTAITNVTDGSGGNGTTSYTWQMSTDNFGADINTIAGQIGITYDPPVLAVTTYYRRVNTSGVCVPGSAFSNVIVMTVNQPVVAGVIGNPQIICSGDDPDALTDVTAPSGGDGVSYSFQWQVSSTGGGAGFANATGASTGATYDPPVLTATRYYRRQVSSGVCAPTFSNEIEVTVKPLPSAANPTGGGAVCSGNPAPDISWALTGTAPFQVTYTDGTSIFGPISEPTNTFTISGPTAAGTYKITVLSDAGSCGAGTLPTVGATVTIGGTAPIIDVPPAISPLSACNDGASTTDPQLTLSLTGASASTIGFKLNYTIDGNAKPQKTFNTDATGDIASGTPVTFSDTELNSLAPSPHVIRLVSIQSPTGCLTLVGLNLNFTVNPRPATPTGANNGNACSDPGTGVAISVTAPAAGFEIAWSKGTSNTLASFVAVTATDGTISGTNNNTFTPATSATATYYAFTQNTTTGCLSTTGLAVTQTQDNKPANADAGSDQPLLCGTTATMAAVAVTNSGTGTWTVVTPGYPGITITNNHLRNTTVSGLPQDVPNGAPIAITLRWTAASALGVCATTDDDVVLTINPLPKALDAAPVLCTDVAGGLTASGVVLSDYNDRVTDITGSAATRTVTYYSNSARTTVITTPPAFATGQIFYTRVQDIATNCSKDGIITFTVEQLPAAVPNKIYQFCESSVGSGTATGINLVTLVNPDIRGGAPATAANRLIEWFEDATFTTPIPSGTGVGEDQNYTLVGIGTKKIYARITNLSSSATSPSGTASPCTNTTSVDLILNARPLNNPIQDPSGATPASITLCKSVSPLLFKVDATVTPGSTYTWTVPTGPGQFQLVAGGGTNSPNFFVLLAFPNQVSSPGLPITVQETINGCPGNIQTITVIVDDSPPAPTIVGTNNVCENQTGVNFQIDTPNPTSTYTWTLPPLAVISGSNASKSSIFVDFNVFPGDVTVTESNTTGCTSLAAAPHPVNMFARPLITSTNTTVCSGTSPSGNGYVLTSSIGGSTFNWQVVSITGSVIGTAVGNTALTSQLTESITNISGSTAFVTYRVTPIGPAPGNCSGPTTDIVVTVNPQPIITSPTSNVICSKGTVAPFTADVIGTTFTWSVINVTGTVSGTAIGDTGAGNINQTLVNTSGANAIVTYRVVPKSPPPCIGAFQDIDVTVIPEPVITSLPTDEICSGNTPSVVFTSNVLNSTFSWTVIAKDAAITGTTIGSAGSGNINQVLSNISGSVATVTFRITPKGPTPNNCVGDFQDLVVTVNPQPVITSPSTAVTCSGFAPASFVFTSNLPGSTFAWTVTNITGTISGTALGNAGTGNLNEVITNTSGTNATVTYRVVPTAPAPTVCPGAFQDVILTIAPQPVMTSGASNTICGGGIPTLVFASNIPGSTFVWTVTGITGTVGGTLIGDTGTGNINQTLINISGSAATVTYEVVPTGPNPNNCKGTPQVITINVIPQPGMTSPAVDNICSGSTPGVVFTSDVPGSTFSWTVTALSGAVSGTSIGNTGSGNIGQTLTNVSGIDGTVTYQVIPTSPSPDNCIGFPQNVVVTVVSQPAMSSPSTNTICSGSAPTLVFNSTIGGSTFAWEVIAKSGVIGGSTIGNTGNGNINQVLTNTSGVNGTVTYRVTPTGPAPNNCVGAFQDVVITINPEPVMTSAVANTICSGQVPGISFTANVASSTFAWTVTGITGTVGGATIGNTGNGNISQVLTNTSGANATVTYDVTPTGPGPSNCPGAIQTVVVTVVPQPVMTSPSSNTVCSGSTPGITLTANVAGGTFAWTVTGVTAAVSGATVGNSGAGTSINQTLINTSGSNGTVTYQVIPTGPNPNDCIGAPQIVTITVISQPVMTSTNVNTICSDSAPTLTFDTNITGSTFTWQVIAIGGSIGGTSIGSAGTGNLSEVLTNTSGVNGTVTYRVTPAGPGPNNCIGAPQDVTITVISKPVMTSASTNKICSGNAPSLVFTSNILGSSFAWQVTAMTGSLIGTTVGNAGTGNIGEVLTNNSGAVATVTYRVIPTGPSTSLCVGDFQDVIVTVVPQPEMTSLATNRICSGLAPTLVFASNVPGSTFAWQVTAKSASVTGTSVGNIGVGNISHLLTNVSGSTGTVTYSVTPTGPGPENCVGTSQLITVTVVSQPVMTSAPSKTICSGNTPGLIFTSNISGSIFNWEVINISGTITGTVVADTGSGNIGQTLTNISGSTGSVTYRVTPTGPAADNCTGASQDVTITVTPQPVMTSLATDNICSGNSPAVIFTSNVLGSSFAWVVTNINGAITGTGIGNTGSGAITQTLVNVSNTSGTVTYRVTPTGPVPDNCPGVFQDLIVTVHPEPTAPLITTIEKCSREAVNFDLQTLINNSPSPVSSKFRYTVSVEPGAASSEVAISGLDRVTASTAPITDSFTHLAIASNADAVVVYTVTPFSNSDNCPGTPFKLRVIVHPEPRAQNASQTLCGTGGALVYSLHTQILNGVTSKYTYTVINDPTNPLPVIDANRGTFGNPATATTADINFSYVNTTGADATITYKVTPYSTMISSLTGLSTNCQGQDFFYTITISPQPVGVDQPVVAVCSDNTFTLDPQINVGLLPSIPIPAGANGVQITSYTWTAVYDAGLSVNGAVPPSSGTAPNPGDKITGLLTNTGSTTLNAVYTIFPKSGICAGPFFKITVPITPEPVMDPSLANPSPICSTNPVSTSGTGVVLRTIATSINADTYIVSLKSKDFGLVGTPTVGTFAAVGGVSNAIENDTYRNTTAAQLKVVYTVVPQRNGCSGDPFDITVLVNPEPVLSTTGGTACSTNALNQNPINVVLGTNGASVNASSYAVLQITYSTNGVTFNPALPVGFTRIASPGVGPNLIRNDKYNNITGTPVTVRYSIQGKGPMPTECLSEAVDIDVIIDPEPILSPNAADICSGLATGLTLNEAAGSSLITSYELISVIPATGAIGLTADASNAIPGVYTANTFLQNDKFYNVSSVDQIMNYTIVPISGLCKGTKQIIAMTVHPAPAIVAGLDAKVCSGSQSGIVLVDNSAANAPKATTPFSIAAVSYDIISVTVDAGLTIITTSPTGVTTNVNEINDDRFDNLTSNPLTVTYKIVPISASGCRGPEKTILLTVEPLIVVTANSTIPDICSGGLTNIVIQSLSNPTPNPNPLPGLDPLITFSYFMVPVSGISGNTSGSNIAQDPISGYTIKDALVNNSSTNAAVTVHYKVTALAASSADGKGCLSSQEDVAVIVEPKPKLQPSKLAQTTCEGIAIAGVTLNSPTIASSGNGVVVFELISVIDPLTNAAPTNVAGYSAVGKIYNVGDALNDALTNTSLVAPRIPQTIRYTFQPHFSTGLLCAGDDVTIEITVNPKPDVIPSATSMEICSSESIEVQLPVNTDPASTITKWSASASSVDVVGESNGAGDVLFQTLLNNSSTPQTVTYTVTPSFNGCSGVPKAITVTVNPLPKFNSTASTLPVLPSKVTVCDGTSLNMNLLTYSTGATTFKWEVTDVNNLGTANEFDGTGTAITKSFVNNGDASATLIYQVTPIFEGTGSLKCEGIPRTITVSVAPQITVLIEPADAVCEGTPVFIVFELKGQAPFDFVYSATDAIGTVNTAITRSGNIKVEKVTPTLTTTYTALSAKDALGCPVTFPSPPVSNPAPLPSQSQTVTVYKKVTANWTASIPPFLGGTSVVGFTNTSTPVDGSVFDYNWSFGTDGYVNPLTATGVGPFAITYTRPGDHYVSLTASNRAAPVELGCESTFSAKITIPVLPLVADFRFDPKAACFPTTIKITENTATGVAMDWVVRDGNNSIAATSNAPLPEFMITNPGKYTISLRTYDPFTNQEAFAPTAGKDFTIYDNPVASFDVRPTLVYVPDTELSTFNFSTGAPEYLWDFGDGSISREQEPKYTYKIEGIYDITLVAINDHGDGAVCTDTLSRKITAKQGGITKVPNAFTPNPNGPSGGVAGNNTFNDVFLPIVKGAEEFNMQIFDRWGNLLFESNNSNIGWDGYDKGGKLMPAGVYVYKLTVRLSDGQRSTQLGDITMIR